MRITRVYTRQGDQGMTRLGDGTPVAKDHPRVVAYGEVDLANSTVGVVRAELRDPELDAVLEDVQHRLFDLGGVLCVPGAEESSFTAMLDDRIARLEALMDGWMAAQGPLEEFILPGGTRASALLHVARCQVRRAEQLVVALRKTEAINPAAVRYLNRLSDALFVMAREANRRAGVADVTWKPAGKKPA
ncbi:MAG TPA: cob(I)yrinic acid a,c-diamide adenosyltransferase [Planctomycetota bacterium]|nr:cob(I)yrinic acid a,c-diamide adenosyltransferase [Planctomycetota bacterium]